MRRGSDGQLLEQLSGAHRTDTRECLDQGGHLGLLDDFVVLGFRENVSNAELAGFDGGQQLRPRGARLGRLGQRCGALFRSQYW